MWVQTCKRAIDEKEKARQKEEEKFQITINRWSLVEIGSEGCQKKGKRSRMKHRPEIPLTFTKIMRHVCLDYEADSHNTSWTHFRENMEQKHGYFRNKRGHHLLMKSGWELMIHMKNISTNFLFNEGL